MITKRQQQALETKAMLLTISKQLIVRDGYSRVTINQICNECKVAKGTFYLYFKSKKDIVGEILTDLTDEIFREFNQIKSGSAINQILCFHDTYIRSVKNQGIEFTKEFILIILSIQMESNGETNLHQDLIEELLRFAVRGKELPETTKVADFARNYILHLYSVIIDWCTRKDDVILTDSRYWLEQELNRL